MQCLILKAGRFTANPQAAARALRPSVPTAIRNSVMAVFLVTGARTVAILIDCFKSTACGLMFVLPVIAGMTTRTIGLIRRELPLDNLGVRLMTGSTGQVTSVIERLE